MKTTKFLIIILTICLSTSAVAMEDPNENHSILDNAAIELKYNPTGLFHTPPTNNSINLDPETSEHKEHSGVAKKLLQIKNWAQLKWVEFCDDLIIASADGDCEKVIALFNLGADINAKNNMNDTPLHWAANNGHIEIVRMLIDRGANVNAKNKFGYTPLSLAAGRGRLPTAQLLVAKGAEINFGEGNRGAPFHLATSQGNQEMISFLMECGAQTHAKDNDGDTPLHIAAEKGDLEIVQLLLTQPQFATQRPKQYRGNPGKPHAIKTLQHICVMQLLTDDNSDTDCVIKHAVPWIVQCYISSGDSPMGHESGMIEEFLGEISQHTNLTILKALIAELQGEQKEIENPSRTYHPCNLIFKACCLRQLKVAQAYLAIKNENNETPYKVAPNSHNNIQNLLLAVSKVKSFDALPELIRGLFEKNIGKTLELDESSV